jgi:hypothetical protein
VTVYKYNSFNPANGHFGIKGIREGWNDNTKRVLLNWKGQWYDIDKDKAFGHKKQYKNWLEINIK